jgi:hypothetical protein
MSINTPINIADQYNILKSTRYNLDSINLDPRLVSATHTYTEFHGNYKNFSYDFINFIIKLKRKVNNVLYVDFITCNIFTNEDHQHDIAKLFQEHNISIRYSTNEFGYQMGDYILEYPNKVDIYNIYFTHKLHLWRHVLSGSGIEITKDQLNLYNISYNVNKKTYKLHNNTVMPNNVYIKISDGETFDGNNKTITVSGVSYGFLYVDDVKYINDYPVIKNLNSIATVGANGGGILQAYCNNFKIINCKHIGSLVGTHAGGMCSKPLGYFDQTHNNKWGFKIINCEHDGDMNNSYVGGIIGGGYANNISINLYVNISIINCTNNGNITNEYCGGICGTHNMYGCFGNNNYGKFNCKIIDCVNNGNINGNYNGGLCTGCDNYGGNKDGGGCFGNNNYGKFNCKIIDCVNNGNINGNYNSGICVGGNNYISTNINSIIINGGGCFGNNNYGKFNCDIIKCINSGNLNGSFNGGICAGGNNYVADDNGVGIINGGGCFGNNNYGYLRCNINKCINNGNIIGDYIGGICASGYNDIYQFSNSSGGTIINGGGCFGNNNYKKLKIIIYSCKNEGNIIGNNCSGVCCSSYNYIELEDYSCYINGGGCFGNNNYGNFKCEIIKCINRGYLTGLYNGGICSFYMNLMNNSCGAINGGGCFGNNNYGFLECNIIKCINYGNITSTYSCAGICLSGSNIMYYYTKPIISESIINGGGCFGNNNNNICKCTIIKCINNGNMYGSYNSGICVCQINYIYIVFNITVPITINGGGCFGNNNNKKLTINIYKCTNNGNISGNYSSGMFNDIGNVNLNLYYNMFYVIRGGGCFVNNNNGIISCIINKCINNSIISGNNNGGICNGGCNMILDAFAFGGGCFGNYNNKIINIIIKKCINNTIINGNNNAMFSGHVFDVGGLVGSVQFCACNYNKGTINVIIKACVNKCLIIGIYNGGYFNNVCGCYNYATLDGYPSVLNFLVESCVLYGSITNLNNSNPSGGLFSNIVLCYNDMSINKIKIKKCKFNIYIEGITSGIITGGYINYSNNSSNKLNLDKCKFIASGYNIGLFGGYLNVLSDINSQTNIKHIRYYNDNINTFIIMPYNITINTFNNINLSHIKIYSTEKYLLLQPNYLYSLKS